MGSIFFIQLMFPSEPTSDTQTDDDRTGVSQYDRPSALPHGLLQKNDAQPPAPVPPLNASCHPTRPASIFRASSLQNSLINQEFIKPHAKQEQIAISPEKLTRLNRSSLLLMP
jgi:hypothetical protein